MGGEDATRARRPPLRYAVVSDQVIHFEVQSGGTMHCASCGAANPENARFCEKCGAPLGASQPEPMPTTAPEQPSAEDAREAANRALSAAREAIAAAPPSIFFMSTLVAWVSRGDFFRRFVSMFLRIAAVLTAIGGALVVITVAVMGFREVYGAGEVLAVLLVLIVMTVSVYMYAHLFWIRSRTVSELPHSHYSAIPVASVLIKLAGEQLAVASIVSGVVGLVVALFAGGYAPYAMGGLGSPSLGFNPFMTMFAGGGAVLGGLGVLIGGIVGAFLVLIVAYMIAEGIVVLVDMAQDMRLVRESGE